MGSPTDYVQSRRLGDATITAINDGALPLRVELTAPEEEWRQDIDVDRDGRIAVAIHVLLVQIGDATILIDAGLDEPGSAWEQRFLEEWPGSVRTPGVAAGLASIGVKPEDVTHVLVTHTHFDHVVGLAAEHEGRLVPRYPNARLFLGRADWENASKQHLEPEQRARVGAVAEAGMLELVDDEREIVPGVTMIAAPGESPGHSVIRVSSGGETLYAVGDLFHFAPEVEHPEWMVPWAHRERMLATRRWLLDDAASTDAVVVFSHENFPPWGHIVGEGKGSFRWQRG